ncbi:hypothetical protein ACFPA8_07935 [Streptomyces ovatisporus]|uniref:Uncharacterized protein n=1 Tax=Streptomyces ovatisporus TaxID=1128682 RepID=A0ABV9A577_9ACTN
MATQYPGWLAGQRITAARISASLPQFVYCETNLDRTTSTLSADPVLQFPLEANAVYVVEFCLFLGATATAQRPRTRWSAPTASDGLRGVFGPGSTATSDNNITARSGCHGMATIVEYGIRGANTNLQHITEAGTVFTTDAGTLALEWAQTTTSATFTRRGMASWGRCTRVG